MQIRPKHKFLKILLLTCRCISGIISKYEPFTFFDFFCGGNSRRIICLFQNAGISNGDETRHYRRAFHNLRRCFQKNREKIKGVSEKGGRRGDRVGGHACLVGFFCIFDNVFFPSSV